MSKGFKFLGFFGLYVLLFGFVIYLGSGGKMNPFQKKVDDTFQAGDCVATKPSANAERWEPKTDSHVYLILEKGNHSYLMLFTSDSFPGHASQTTWSFGLFNKEYEQVIECPKLFKEASLNLKEHPDAKVNVND